MDKRPSLRECVEDVFEKMSKSQRERFDPSAKKQAKDITMELKRRREEKLKNG